jgi:hypothetical protein
MVGLRRVAAPLVVAGSLVTLTASATAVPILDDLLGSKPSVSASAATSVTGTGATLHGKVDPNGLNTKYFFEYGTTVAYGTPTSQASAGGGNGWVQVAAVVSGLEPNTTYHFRLVATNSKGTTRSGDLTFQTATAPPDPDPGEPDPGEEPGGDSEDPGSGSGSGTGSNDPADPNRDERSPGTVEPELGKSVLVAPSEGDLRVRLPGRSAFAPLAHGSELPVGTEIDASAGSIALTSALPSGELQTGRFGGGRFKIGQGRDGYVDLYLRGRACPRPRAKHSLATASTAANKPRKRRLWGRDHGGRFRTHGRNSHATVRGTRWVVGDSCAGTLTRVTSGSVVVRDRVRHKRLVLQAGERYLARPPR